MSLSENESKKAPTWWQGGSLYQVYPRSFADSNQDGVGDINGIISRLNYIAELGVSGLWLGPIFKSPMVDFGYDVSDYRKIDPTFGSCEDFQNLLKECQEKNLKVILDLVMSHTSEEHPWFIDSEANPMGPYGDWYVWADGKDGEPPNNWLSVFGGSAWSWSEKRGQYYLHNFLRQQPDLNFHNEKVQQEMLDIAKFWLDQGVDGFRLDACNCYFHNPSLQSNPMTYDHHSHVQDENNPYFQQAHLYDKSQPENREFLVQLRALTEQYPNRFLVGEIFCDREEETTQDYAQNAFPLHSTYNFSLLQNTREDNLFRHTVTKYFGISESTSWCLSNHDVMRVVSRWPDALPYSDRAKSYLTLLSGLPGLSILYQGEELGLSETFLTEENRLDPFGSNIDSPYPGRDGCRTPLPWTKEEFAGFSTTEPWLPIPKEHFKNCVASQIKRPTSVINQARGLFDFRKDNPVVARGNIFFWRDDKEMIAFTRTLDHETLLYFASFSNLPIEMQQVGSGEIIDGISHGALLENNGLLKLEPGACGVARLVAP